MSSAPEFSITVFTPVYNRASTLPRVWESLLAQTFRDFEWLIVDDGSTDETPELAARYLQQAPFPVRYFRQENQHKKVAHNLAVREARGAVMLALDSDDRCVPNALERLWWHWNNIPEAEREQFSAVTVLCQDEDGQIVGDRFPGGEWIDSTSTEITYRHRVRGEKWGFHRLDVLRRFSFPTNVKGYVPESYVWVQIDRHYKTRYVNEALRIYYRDQYDSQITGMTRDPRPAANGAVVGTAPELCAAARYFFSDPKGVGKLAANFVRLLLHSTLTLDEKLRFAWTDQSWAARLLILLTAPIGLAAFLRDYFRHAGKHRS
jgi:glycosyltransferase involved in cell wall biosynthesis